MVAPSPSVATGSNDIRTIKPPVPIGSGWGLWLVLVGLTALALLALLFWRRFRHRPHPVSQVPPVPAHVRARQRLEAALEFLSDPREFCGRVSDAIRQYLEEQFCLRAPERTTEEFLRDLGLTSVLNSGQKATLAEFLQRCDLVKFARYEPTEAALRELHDTALRLVHETHYESTAAVPLAPDRKGGVTIPDQPDPTVRV